MTGSIEASLCIPLSTPHATLPCYPSPSPPSAREFLRACPHPTLSADQSRDLPTFPGPATLPAPGDHSCGLCSHFKVSVQPPPPFPPSVHPLAFSIISSTFQELLLKVTIFLLNFHSLCSHCYVMSLPSPSEFSLNASDALFSWLQYSLVPSLTFLSF